MYRAGLVALQTETKNRIHSILHRHGIFHEYTDLFGVQGRAFLAGLCSDEDNHLPAGALRALRGHIILTDQIRRQLADIARSLRLELERSPLTQRLNTIPGVGLILSHILVAEIGHLERFANHRKLASYCCLAPLRPSMNKDELDFGNFQNTRNLRKTQNLAGLKRNRYVDHGDHDDHELATIWLQ